MIGIETWLPGGDWAKPKSNLAALRLGVPSSCAVAVPVPETNDSAIKTVADRILRKGVELFFTICLAKIGCQFAIGAASAEKAGLMYFAFPPTRVNKTLRSFSWESVHSVPRRLLTELLCDLDQRTANVLHIVIRKIIGGSHRLHSKVSGQRSLQDDHFSPHHGH